MLSILFLLSLNAFGAPADKALCRVESAGHGLAILHLGAKTIDIIGWEHLEDEDVKSVREGLEQAFDQAKKHDCSGAKKSLSRGIKLAKDGLDRSSFVLSALETIHKRLPLDRIGVELSPADLDGEAQAIESVQTPLGAIEKACGAPIITETNQSRIAYFGPAETFHLKHKNVALVGAESLEALKKNQTDFAVTVSDDFDDLKNPHRTLPGYQKIVDALFDEKRIPEEAIMTYAKSLSGDKDPAASEAQIRKDLLVWKKRMVGAYVRNEEIVKNMMDLPGHSALTIGFRHVPNLSKKFIEACEAAAQKQTQPKIVEPPGRVIQ